ncbi:DUF3991 and TOPRIM domain-containing protein [Paludicola sp. MB14-C6]|uniref:DUF3991 and TOPRIM domain-containing protein n=1 Tax=Paludihabitans sp. MB14-C6 TaxID=3070656 RepID=UPI0027DAEDC3|nr:DUF3991 and TOPRIM domain-containing protein [Paludicola sp. MB14-C6]WMJ22887.1 DUF3991 and TOPRIM domain-containing protein [Paludicola sp. MB14-C6]
MSYVSPERLEKSKQMDLITYLQNYEPNELIQLSRSVFTTRAHDSLKISNGKWYWWSRGFGGVTALDYLIKVKGMSLPDAVSLIDGRVAEMPPVLHTQKQENNYDKTLYLPERNDNNEKVRSYLKNRGIHDVVIDYCINTKRLYEDKKYHNAVFVGFNKDNLSKYAFVRGTGEKRFMKELSGSDKRFSFSIPSNEKSETLHIFESAIDLLSYATLQLFEGKDWKSDHYLSLSGVYQQRKESLTIPLPLKQLLEEQPQIKSIHLHLDNDKAGRDASKAIIENLSDQYIVFDEPPTSGKDCNDQLKALMGIGNKNHYER